MASENSVSGATKVAGIVGWPIRHSLSPLLHGHWLAAHKIDGAFVPLPVRREDFALVINALQRAGFRGVNVTVPHKEAAFALADFNDEAARNAGAANLLVFHDNGRIEGRNTDVPGLVASLTEALGEGALRGNPVVLLGAGGAARGAVLALNRCGAGEIRILNRTGLRAEELVRALAPRVATKLALASWPEAAKDAGLLLNATSAGMEGKNALDLALDALPATAIVSDMVYNPLETDLLARAHARGLKTIDGLGMLMHQAVPAFASFYGVEPKVTTDLRAALEAALGA